MHPIHMDLAYGGGKWDYLGDNKEDKLVRVFIMLADWCPGQVILMGNEHIVKWKKGDVIYVKRINENIMIPVKVIKISYHPTSRSYAVILKEITGEKCLPVIVGSFEAQSIALAIESVDTPRPLTHDLICDVLTGIDSLLKTVRINSLEDGVFYAQMEIESDSFGNRIIDARPSDAIAVALRMNTPILVSSKVLKEASVSEDSLSNDTPKAKKSTISLKSLKEKLKSAIEEEEYEIAAKLRDKISDLES